MAWSVARSYNATHLDDRRMLWWHASGAALTIWLTRNWTQEQILAAAARLEAPASNQQATPATRPNEQPEAARSGPRG